MQKHLGLLGGAALALAACNGGGDSLVTDTDASTGNDSSSTAADASASDTLTTSATATATATAGDTDTDATSTTNDTLADTTDGGSCGDGVVDGSEACDGSDLAGSDCAAQGYDGGTLACNADCTFDLSACTMANCGDGTINGKEVCDGTELGAATCMTEGFDGGTLACAADCASLDTTGCAQCGNGIIDAGEDCDVSLGGQSCVGQGYDSGALHCNADCTFDFSDCGDCGNGVIDGTEFCDGDNVAGEVCTDNGYDSGVVSCAANCTGFDFSTCGNCGNDIVDGDEFCDGFSVGGQTCQGLGFNSGTLACLPACGGFDTASCGTCGNGIIDGSEACDGDLLGGATCASLGLEGGELACSGSCTYDFGGCDIPGLLFGSDDSYNGYSFTPPVLPCDDISATGTNAALTDDSEAVANIGFSFPLYGTLFDQVTIQSNGAIHFGGDGVQMSFSNVCLPSATNPSDDDLYVFWDDLNPGAAGAVRYQTLGSPGSQRFIVQWDVPHYSGDTTDLLRFQAMMEEATGNITVCYPDVQSAANAGDFGAEATVGLQQDSVVGGVEFSCNTAALSDGLEILYIPN